MSRLFLLFLWATSICHFKLVLSQSSPRADTPGVNDQTRSLQRSRSQHVDTYPPPPSNHRALRTYQSTADVQAANIHRASSLPSHIDASVFPPPFLRRHQAQQRLDQDLQDLRHSHAVRHADFTRIHANPTASRAIEGKLWQPEALAAATARLELNAQQYPGHVGLALQRSHALWHHALAHPHPSGAASPESSEYQRDRDQACHHWEGAAVYERYLRREMAVVRAQVRHAEHAARLGFPAARRESTELAIHAALRVLATADRALRLDGKSLAEARARVELRRARELCRPVRRVSKEEAERGGALGKSAIVRQNEDARRRGGAHVLALDEVHGGLKSQWAYHGVLQGREGKQVGGSLAAAWEEAVEHKPQHPGHAHRTR